MVDIIGNVVGIEQLVSQISSLTTLFQAIGGFVIAYIIFNILNIIWNRKKNKELKQIRILLEKINRKFDRLK